MITNKDLYVTLTQLIVHAETISWNRLYNFFMGNTILVLAWATIYASTQAGVLTNLTLSAICVLGGAFGPSWAKLGVRTREHLEAYFTQALALDNNPSAWDANAGSQRPFVASAAIRDRAEWYSKNVVFLRTIPLAFTALYILMLIASWFGRS